MSFTKLGPEKLLTEQEINEMEKNENMSPTSKTFTRHTLQDNYNLQISDSKTRSYTLDLFSKNLIHFKTKLREVT
jgi:hypothetical protein